MGKQTYRARPLIERQPTLSSSSSTRMMMSTTTTTTMKVSTIRPGVASVAKRVAGSAATRRTTSMGDTQVIMSLANGAALAIGRFGFLPYQRRKIEEAGLPLQNGETYVEAGDKLAEEAEVFSTKDPAGFTLIDTMAWGSIGHVLGYAALAAKNANDLGVVVSPHW